MSLRFYNSFGQKLQPFRPLKKSRISMYTCGPTVYNFPHIGNLRTFVFADILKRWLEYKKFRVTHVMNITDVDDKTIRGSQEAGMNLEKFTKRFEDVFFDDMKLLNIVPASVYCHATGHIKEMISLIQKLVEAKFAYKAGDGLYFDISEFPGYGKFSGLAKEFWKSSVSRISADEYEKDNVQDFALWKFWKESDGDVAWESPWGKGRPGWHIECSAMSTKYLGRAFDIHTGGIDLKFPHHENEICQSQGAGYSSARFWLHCEHLMVEGKKMSKSLGNIIILKDIAEKNISPLALRYLFISSQYRSQMNFTWESLEHAADTIQKLNDFYSKVSWLSQINVKDKVNLSKQISKIQKKFEDYMDDDLNTPEALSSMHNIISEFHKAFDNGTAGSVSAKLMLKFLKNINSIFAVIDEKSRKIKPEHKRLIEQREKLRKEKKFVEADKIRGQLKSMGISLEDTPYGPRWII